MKKIFTMTKSACRLWPAVLVLALALPVMQGCRHATTEKTPDAYGFFPIYGVYLGQTTLYDLWDMDYKPKVEKTMYTCDIADDVDISDYEKDRTFEHMMVFYSKYDPDVDPTPKEWKEKFGFKRNLSHSQWMSLFKKLGFSVEEEKSSSDFKIVSTSPDKSLVFKLKFDYTEESKKSGKQNINTSYLSYISIESEPGNSSNNVVPKAVNDKSNTDGNTPKSAAPAATGGTTGSASGSSKERIVFIGKTTEDIKSMGMRLGFSGGINGNCKNCSIWSFWDDKKDESHIFLVEDTSHKILDELIHDTNTTDIIGYEPVRDKVTGNRESCPLRYKRVNGKEILVAIYECKDNKIVAKQPGENLELDFYEP